MYHFPFYRRKHNNLRITRIIRSLSLLGCERLAPPFVEFLATEIFQHNTLPSCRNSCLSYWISALHEEHQARVQLYVDGLRAPEDDALLEAWKSQPVAFKTVLCESVFIYIKIETMIFLHWWCIAQFFKIMWLLMNLFIHMMMMMTFTIIDELLVALYYIFCEFSVLLLQMPLIVCLLKKFNFVYLIVFFILMWCVGNLIWSVSENSLILITLIAYTLWSS